MKKFDPLGWMMILAVVCIIYNIVSLINNHSIQECIYRVMFNATLFYFLRKEWLNLNGEEETC